MDIGGRVGAGAHTTAELAVSWRPSILEPPTRQSSHRERRICKGSLAVSLVDGDTEELAKGVCVGGSGWANPFRS